MDFENISVGCDIEQISRFKDKIDNRIFLQKIFTDYEINYCLSRAKPEEHFAVRFCAKEAVIKSLTEFDITGIFYKDIEIVNEKSGMPKVKILKLKKNIQIKISLSHSGVFASAMVVACRQGYMATSVS